MTWLTIWILLPVYIAGTMRICEHYHHPTHYHIPCGCMQRYVRRWWFMFMLPSMDVFRQRIMMMFSVFCTAVFRVRVPMLCSTLFRVFLRCVSTCNRVCVCMVACVCWCGCGCLCVWMMLRIYLLVNTRFGGRAASRRLVHDSSHAYTFDSTMSMFSL